MGFVTACSAKMALAADEVNFSGKYLAERKAAPGRSGLALEVVQNNDYVEITRMELGKKTTSRCPLNGSEGDYTSLGGISGKCKAQRKGKYLIVESVVVTRPQPTTAVRMHTKERWQLSTDVKTLTIKSDVDFPDFPADISAAVAGNTSGIMKYTRTDFP